MTDFGWQYPPGVTGAEPQIDGYPEGRERLACRAETRRINHRARPAGPIVDYELEECGWSGMADVTYYNHENVAVGDCGDCGSEITIYFEEGR